MDHELGGASKSPNIEYFFVQDVMSKYDDLQKAFKNGTHAIVERAGWWDDMKFMYHLICAFRYFHENKCLPLIKFQKIPNISNARWNSRAILALLAFFLMPHERKRLEAVCHFISIYDWADHWFSDQMYRAEDYEELSGALQPYKTALKCLQNHWKRGSISSQTARIRPICRCDSFCQTTAANCSHCSLSLTVHCTQSLNTSLSAFF